MNKRTRKRIRGVIITFLLVGLIIYFHKSIIRFGYKAYRELYERNYPVNVIPGRIEVPENYSVHGIDISRWQSEINWKNLSALNTYGDTIHMTFSFIKATEGILWEDPMFDDNWKNADDANITRGAYHYFKPKANAKLQAKNFISSVKLKKGDLPPVLDIEETGKQTKKELVASLKIYLTLIEEHYHTRPIIYSNINFIETYLADDFKDYSFWIAHYYTDKLRPAPGIKWLFWQYHDQAKVSGCNECIDVNVFKGSAKDFNQILIQQ